MKKIISIFLVLILILTLTATVFAEQKEDLFYYDIESDVKLQQYMKSSKEEATSGLEKTIVSVLNIPGKFDENKLTFHYENAYAMYDWTYTDLIGFIETENKADFLKRMDLWYVIIPISYDGEQIYNTYLEYGYDVEKGRFVNAGYGMFSNRYNLTDKQEAERILKADGFEGYTVLRTVSLDGNVFIIAQKDVETVAVYVSADKIKSHKMYPYMASNYDGNKTKFYEVYKETFDNKIFTADDFGKLDVLSKKLTEDAKSVEPEKYLIGSGGADMKPDSDAQQPMPETGATVSADPAETVTDTAEAVPDAEIEKTDAPLAEDSPEKDSPVIWIVLGAIVLIAAGALTIALIKKKKA